ncbi:MAG: DUF6438 domain-containing protein [Saprospiraceae bacterium]
MTKVYILIIFIGLYLFSCNRHIIQPIQEDNQIQKIIALSKSSCFGKCAVYTLTVYKDGLVILQGIANLDKIGVYHSTLNVVQLDQLTKKIYSLNWKSYKSKYLRNIPDLPVTTLKIFNNTDSSQIEIQSNSSLPQELEEIHKDLSLLIENNAWLLALKDKEVNSGDLIKNQIQIDMDSTQSVAHLEQLFKPYEFKMTKRISEYMNFYLFEFNTAKIAPYEMVVLARRVKGIRLVTFNKKLNQRDEF